MRAVVGIGFVCLLVSACGESGGVQPTQAEAVDGTLNAGAGDGRAVSYGSAEDGLDACEYFESGIIPDVFGVGEGDVTYRRSIPNKRAGHVVCSASWNTDGHAEASITLIADEYDTVEQARMGVDSAIQIASRRSSDTPAFDTSQLDMDVGNAAVFTPRGTLHLVVGTERLVVGTSVSRDPLRMREEALRLARRIVEGN